MRSRIEGDANDIRAFFGRMAEEAHIAREVPVRVLRRARARLVGMAVAGLLVLGLAGYGASALLEVVEGWNRTIPAKPSPPFTAASLRRFVIGDAELVREIVAASAGSELLVKWPNSGPWGPSKIGRTIFVPSASDMREAGLQTAFGAVFATERFKRTAEPDRLTVVSLAMLFPDEQTAHRGFIAFRDGPKTTFTGWHALPAEGLGEESMGGRAP